jgi:hypothetical protein
MLEGSVRRLRIAAGVTEPVVRARENSRNPNAFRLCCCRSYGAHKALTMRPLSSISKSPAILKRTRTLCCYFTRQPHLTGSRQAKTPSLLPRIETEPKDQFRSRLARTSCASIHEIRESDQLIWSGPGVATPTVERWETANCEDVNDVHPVFGDK